MVPLLELFTASAGFDAVIRATFALAASALAAAVLRRASASVRHLIWASALGGAMAIPLLMIALPAWRVDILARPKSSESPLSMESTPRILAERNSVSIGHVSDPVVSPSELSPLRRSLAASAFEVSEARSFSLGSRFWILAVWSVGFVSVLVPLAIAHVKLRRFRRSLARTADKRLEALTEALCESMIQARRVELLQGDASVSPMTWGVARPVIFLPAGAENWPDERLRAVLLHELAHVRRWDCLSQTLAYFACALYWFNPLAWYAAHRMRVESEQACDDLVLRSGALATDYASHLLAVARTLRVSPGLSAAAVPMARPSQLESRLRTILDRSRSRRILTRRGAFVLLVPVALLLLPLSAARPAIEDKDTDVKNKKDAPPKQAATMTVSGRVLNPDGKPVASAKVGVAGRRKLAALTARSEPQYISLGNSEAGADGKFRLEVARTSSLTHYEVKILASSPGMGMGWAEINHDAESPSIDVTLKPEQVVEGRLVDLQGAPAPGVLVRISSVGVIKKEVHEFDGLNFWETTPKGLEDIWPKSVTSDDDGRFRITGIGRSILAGLQVNDRRYARQGLRVVTDDAEGPKRTTLPLQAVMTVTGRVTCADTGEPFRNAIVVVGSGSNMFATGGSEYRTDDDGKYEANPASGKYLKVTVYPPDGSPYLIFERNFNGIDDGKAKWVVDLAVPRGVLITGKVTTAGQGTPVSAGSIFYENGQGNVVEGQGTIPGWMSAVSSKPDGTYSIAVAPGKGHLLVYGAAADFVYEMKGGRELSDGKRGGQREYAHAFVPYKVEKGEGPVTKDVTLTPGAVATGIVTGPEGQIVDTAEIVTTLSISPFHTTWRGDFTIPVREGRFELHGIPSDQPVKCSFLDAKNGWGATLEITAAMAAAGPLAVKLQPCGKASARLVDEEGHPIIKGVLNLNIVGTPGVGTDYEGKSLTEEERGMFEADEEIYANVDRLNYWDGPKSGHEGRVTLPKLIPGATYRIYDYQSGRGIKTYRWRDFQVEPGQTLDLGDVRMKRQGR